MATKRLRGSTWHYTVQKKSLLPKPIYLTFDSEEEGDRYVDHLEKLLANGIVPKEFLEVSDSRINTVADAIDAYERTVNVPDSDVRVLRVVRDRAGRNNLSAVDYDWAEEWVAGMKSSNLAPSTIRHHVGALARCFDWVVKKKESMMVANPLRMLPKRYASGHREEFERDHRLSPEHEAEVRRIILGGKPHNRERAFDIEDTAALMLLFEIAIETGMRMKEIYTLTKEQIDLGRRTIFLDKSKNGDKRQVPISTVLLERLTEYLDGRGDGALFPWLDWSKSSDKAAWNEELKRVSVKLSGQFGRIFGAAGCGEFTFHGLRHELTCRLYERTQMTDVQVAKMLGWRSLKMALRYANLRASDLSEKLW